MNILTGDAADARTYHASSTHSWAYLVRSTTLKASVKGWTAENRNRLEHQQDQAMYHKAMFDFYSAVLDG